MHQGKERKFGGRPYIFHPLEVAQILSTMTDDEEVITAGILHDIVEDTAGTLGEIEKLPAFNTLIHGDFHTGNVFLQNVEPLLITKDEECLLEVTEKASLIG